MKSEKQRASTGVKSIGNASGSLITALRTGNYTPTTTEHSTTGSGAITTKHREAYRKSPGGIDRELLALAKTGSRQDAERVLGQMADRLKPATDTEVLKEIQLMWTMMGHRKEDQLTLKLVTMGYGEAMVEYPADILKYVCKRFRDTAKWFPIWAELKAELDFWTDERIEKVNALKADLSN